MIKERLVTATLAVLISGCATTTTQSHQEKSMIVHSVFFKLKHAPGSAEESAFLSTAATLSSIQGVKNYQVLKEIGLKNNFDFGLSMEFADQAAYDGYNNHPDHVAFVQNRWLKEVADFQEIDYIPYSE